MALNYTTIQALINDKYLPVLYDNIFTANHFLLAKLKAKAKIYNERQIVVPVEYAKSTTIDFLARFETIALGAEEVVTAARYTPKMLTGSFTISLEDELENKSDMSIKNVLDTKMKNLQRSIQEKLADHIWLRGTSLADSNGWNTVDYLINDQAATNPGVIPSTAGTQYAWWKSNVIDLTGAEYDDDPQQEVELMDLSKDVYLKTLFARGVAKSKHQTGIEPDCIIVPQYIWDLTERILDPQKTGSVMKVMVGDIGFTALNFRGIPIVADDDMVAAQTGDTDGRIYFMNTEFLYMFFNSGAKFTSSEFVKPANMNARSSLINAYGNIVITNRKSQTVMTNIYSPKTYAA